MRYLIIITLIQYNVLYLRIFDFSRFRCRQIIDCIYQANPMRKDNNRTGLSSFTLLLMLVLSIVSPSMQHSAHSDEDAMPLDGFFAGTDIIRIWLDADPGLDDAIALIMAAKLLRIMLLGVSTSAGNSHLISTTKNTLDILYNLGRSDVPVYMGSSKLVEGEPKVAEYVHGEGGLGGVKIPASDKQAITDDTLKKLRDKIMSIDGKFIWANTGAMTNLCFLLRRFPEIKEKIEKIVMMGGAIGAGNMTPAAEFNIYTDPKAFKCVLENRGDIPVVMIPLEVTHTVQCPETFFEFLQKRSDVPFVKAILNMLRAYQKMYKESQDFDYPPIHDATVLYYLLFPDHFVVRKAVIEVDVGKTSYGRTNCYFYFVNDPRPFVTIDVVATRMKHKAHFWKILEEIIQELYPKGEEL